MDECVAAFAELVLAAVELEFDVSEASALFAAAKPRSWKVMFLPTFLSLVGLCWAIPSSAVLLTGAAGRKT